MTEDSGKITLYAIVVGVLVFGLAVLLDPFKFSAHQSYLANAGVTTATTTVTVLNTPPEWAVDAYEYSESSTSTPTNAGNDVIWVGTASDSNNEPYFLLICKTSSTPTANAGSPPTCNGGGGNLWAVSTSTAANVQATSTYTTSAGDAEANDWFAWICDKNLANPRCNTVYKTGTSATNSSPFVVNHRPSFTGFLDDSPKDPGQVVTWTTTSSDPDTYGGNDQIRLFVCRANDFTTSSPGCGAGGTYCTSTLGLTNRSCSTTLATPLQDQNYTAYGFVIDEHTFPASGGAHASNSVLTVSNVSPTIASSSVQILDTDDVGGLTLANAQTQTTGFKVTFTVADNNSCLNSGSGNEISSTTVNLFRSGIGINNCQTSGNYNPNNCYPAAVGTTTWNYSCSQNGGSCTNASDSDAIWTCTFPLWYLADPTDGADATDTQYFSQDWQASVRATDDNGATSTLTQSQTGNEVLSYLAYSLNTSLIAYGSFEPGTGTPTLAASTTVTATGNVGLDQTLYGDDMCTTYPTCSSSSPTSTIQIYYQKFATSSVAYSSTAAYSATSSPGSELEINIFKPTITSTPATGTTYWGIQLPITITLAGDYTGKNTIIGIKGEAQFW